jgi:hypothetical protein
MFEELVFISNQILFTYVVSRFGFGLIISWLIVFLITWILFLNCNPYKKDETKYTILNYIPQSYRPKMSLDPLNTDLSTLKYPIIFKPSRCSRLSKDVQVIRNEVEASEYLYEHPNEVVIQEFVEYKNEVGILYEDGRIVSMVAKSSKNSDIMKGCDFGSITCTDLTYLITPQLNDRIVWLSQKIPNFHVGRYDIKYRDLNSLLMGQNFSILEVNGTMGFELRKTTSLMNIVLAPYFIERWYLYRLLTGLKNIVKFQGYNISELLNVMRTTVFNMFDCSDWEKFYTLYS